MSAYVPRSPVLHPNNLSSFKFWRERYKFVGRPIKNRQQSELCTEAVEQLVRKNILKPGKLCYKDVIVEILKWGLHKRQILMFQSNAASLIHSKVNTVVSGIRTNPNNVSSFIRVLTGLRGVGIVVASKILRFLDPHNHRYGVIDKYVSNYCKKHNIAQFNLSRAGAIDKNINAYSIYHSWLHEKAKKLRSNGVRFQNVSGVIQDFDPVDVEMAIFAYCTQSGAC